MSTGKEVRAFLATYYPVEGIEVKSYGDASVTVSLPVHTDLTSLVYDMKEEFNADCDLKLEGGQPVIVVHLHACQTLPTSFMYSFLVVAAAVCGLSHQYGAEWASAMNLTWAL